MKFALIMGLSICCAVLYLRKPTAFKRYGISTYHILADVVKGERE
jgi:hypothetical protein